ncbi:hypothetical protein ACVWZ8_001612 [Arthrobacter sp. UYCu723]
MALPDYPRDHANGDIRAIDISADIPISTSQVTNRTPQGNAADFTIEGHHQYQGRAISLFSSLQYSPSTYLPHGLQDTHRPDE